MGGIGPSHHANAQGKLVYCIYLVSHFPKQIAYAILQYPPWAPVMDTCSNPHLAAGHKRTILTPTFPRFEMMPFDASDSCKAMLCIHLAKTIWNVCFSTHHVSPVHLQEFPKAPGSVSRWTRPELTPMLQSIWRWVQKTFRTLHQELWLFERVRQDRTWCPF